MGVVPKACYDFFTAEHADQIRAEDAEFQNEFLLIVHVFFHRKAAMALRSCRNGPLKYTRRSLAENFASLPGDVGVKRRLTRKKREHELRQKLIIADCSLLTANCPVVTAESTVSGTLRENRSESSGLERTRYLINSMFIICINRSG